MAYIPTDEATSLLNYIDAHEGNSRKIIANSDVLGELRNAAAERTGVYTDGAQGVSYKDKHVWRSMQQLPDPGWQTF